MKPKAVVVYKCPKCGRLFGSKDEAFDCCSESEFIKGWQCSKCKKFFEVKVGALVCCQ